MKRDELAVLNYLKTYVLKNGYAPSVREVAKKFGFSTSYAHDHLAALAEDGRIVRVGPRAVRFIDE